MNKITSLLAFDKNAKVNGKNFVSQWETLNISWKNYVSVLLRKTYNKLDIGQPL